MLLRGQKNSEVCGMAVVVIMLVIMVIVFREDSPQ